MSADLTTTFETPSGLSFDWATARVLWWRDVVRFFRQPTRIAGALAQPILFWLVLGSGFSGSFQLPAGAASSGVGYMQYFFPGVLAMVLLFSAIFATITVVEDRQAGFLQSVLAGPGSRFAVVVGKCLGSATVALVQAGLFLFFAPFAGVSLAAVNVPLLFAVMALSALGLTAMGVSLAWWVSSSSGYHAVMSIVLIPMWVLSGAMFPLSGAGKVVGAIMTVNPMRFSVEGLRAALYGDGVTTLVSGASGASSALFLGLFAAGFFGLAAVSVSRRD
jgi:ABC-2 type transport system permease protein